MKSAKALEALLLPGFYQVGLEDSAQRKHIVEMCHAAYLIGVADEREACAKIAEMVADDEMGNQGDEGEHLFARDAALAVAKVIRERGKP